MAVCNTEKIHSDAMGKIKLISDNFTKDFNFQKVDILKKFMKNEGEKIVVIDYPPSDRRAKIFNITNYFSDHVPILKELDDMIIISWNIGIGDNNSPYPYQIIEEEIKNTIKDKRNFKNNNDFKDITINCLVKIINCYIREISKCGKKIVLHLQECSFDAYNKIKIIFTDIKYSSSFMPQEIAKVKVDNGKLVTKLFYIEEYLKTYNSNGLKLGLSSFIFGNPPDDLDIKIYPTSATLYEVYEERTKTAKELILDSRINLVLITINSKKYIHYNLHIKKLTCEKDESMNNCELRAVVNSKKILNTYYNNKFINILDDRKGDPDEIFKNMLFLSINNELSSDNIFKIDIDGNNILFKDEEQFNIPGDRYICGDYNALLRKYILFLRDIDNKIVIESTSNGVDYIIKINYEEEAAAAASSAAEDVAMGGGWQQKYLKYKQKYLKLKNKLELY